MKQREDDEERQNRLLCAFEAKEAQLRLYPAQNHQPPSRGPENVVNLVHSDHEEARDLSSPREHKAHTQTTANPASDRIGVFE